MLGTHDTTIGGSRFGHAPLILWYALHRYGLDGLRTWVRYARDMAAYTVDQVEHIGWPAWRHPHAMTVVLAPPPGEEPSIFRIGDQLRPIPAREGVNVKTASVVQS